MLPNIPGTCEFFVNAGEQWPRNRGLLSSETIFVTSDQRRGDWADVQLGRMGQMWVRTGPLGRTSGRAPPSSRTIQDEIHQLEQGADRDDPIVVDLRRLPFIRILELEDRWDEPTL
jgi:hypothetical protein